MTPAIKIGYQTASKKQLVTEGHTFASLKRARHRITDTLCCSVLRGYRVEGVIIDGKAPKAPKQALSMFSDYYIGQFLKALPNEKQLSVVKRLTEIAITLEKSTEAPIGLSIVIITGKNNNSPCHVKVIDLAHSADNQAQNFNRIMNDNIQDVTNLKIQLLKSRISCIRIIKTLSYYLN